MVAPTSFCTALSTDLPIGGLGLFSFVFAVIQVLTIVLILTWLWRQRRAVAKGVATAANGLVFPVYEWIMWFFAGVVLIQAVANVLLPMHSSLFSFNSTEGKQDLTYSAAYATVWGITHTITEGIAFLLLQHGAGVKAQIRAGVAAVVWGMMTWAVHFLAYSRPATASGAYDSYLLSMSWELLSATFYLVILIAPQRILFRRPALNNFALFWLINSTSSMVAFWLQYHMYDAGQCVYVFSSWALFGVVKPFVIYDTLLKDSQYWLGIFVTSKNKALSIEKQRQRCARQSTRAASASIAVPGSSPGKSHKKADKQSSSLSTSNPSSSVPRSSPPAGGVTDEERGSPLKDMSSDHSDEDNAESSSAAAVAHGEDNADNALQGKARGDATGGEAPKTPERKQDSYYRSDRRISYDVMSPLLGQQLDMGTARSVARGVDALRDEVPLLNFSALSLGTDYHILGAGGTSRVYRGKYQGIPVAIKIIYCMDLTPEVVSGFYDEARVLGRLASDYVVGLYGICVMPPSLCLVMELCQSNLFDLLHMDHFKGMAPDAWGWQGVLQDRVARGLLPLESWDTKLSLAIGCAQGVAYLHQQQPAIIHTDIKSLNFLVSSDLQVKICDLEHSIHVSSVRSVVEATGRKARHDEDGLYRSLLAGQNEEDSPHVPDTLNWSAPDVVQKPGCFTSHSDVYSLAVVMWEIFAGEVPFKGLSQQEMRRELLRKTRYHPPVNSLSFPAPVASLLLDCWKADPASRPSAAVVLRRLQEIRSRVEAHAMDEKEPASPAPMKLRYGTPDSPLPVSSASPQTPAVLHGDMFTVNVDSNSDDNGDEVRHDDDEDDEDDEEDLEANRRRVRVAVQGSPSMPQSYIDSGAVPL